MDQYSNFTILDPQGQKLHVNGRLTLGENIADAGGLSAAFHAWKAIEEKNPAQLLPGLQDFTKEQLFFITAPSLFCGKTRQERAVNLIYKDPHSPSWARILVSEKSTSSVNKYSYKTGDYGKFRRVQGGIQLSEERADLQDLVETGYWAGFDLHNLPSVLRSHQGLQTQNSEYILRSLLYM